MISVARQKRHFIRALLCIAACAISLSVEIIRPQSISRLEEGLRDEFLRIAATASADSRVAIIDIDERSLSELGPWPWSRGKIADLLEALFGTYGIRAAGIDIVFPESADREGDERLASIAAHAPVAFAQIFDYSDRRPPLRIGSPVATPMPEPESLPLKAYGYIANYSGLADTARCVGNIGYFPDADGVLRRLVWATAYSGNVYPTLTWAILGCALPSSAAKPVAPSAIGSDGQWRIPFRRSDQSYTVVSAADVLSETVPRELLQDRLILVGSSSVGINDQVSTPLSPLTAGVMVHAAALSALLDGDIDRVESGWLGPVWIVVSLLVIATGIVLLPAWINAILLLAMASGWLAVAAWLVGMQSNLSVTAPLWGYLWLLLTAVPYEWAKAQERSRRLIQSFSHYVARPVLDEILRRDLEFSLDPKSLEVTVLIADMEDYTRQTSRLSLEEAADLTKGFLDCLTRPILDGGGTLDKYTGDGLVAFWGAPLPCPDQADRSVAAALAIVDNVRRFNAGRVAQGGATVRVRIGIESGIALVGDLGTPFRSTYTAVGDCINFASRLEASARYENADIVIGEIAASKLTGYAPQPLGTLPVRGTDRRISTFTVAVPEASGLG